MTVEEPVVADPLLWLNDLHVSFDTIDGESHVINGVDLSIGRGEVVVIAGETGCGKSVTMKSILNLLEQPPANVSAEEMQFDGTDLTALSDKQYDALKGRRMSIIFQNPMSSLVPVHTIGEQLIDTAQFGGGVPTNPLTYARKKYTGNHRARAREQVIEMLEEVRLPNPEELLDTYPHQLSGGMQQRVLIAQALLNEPDLLIADEIGTALDVTIYDQILDLLEELIDRHNISVLMVTHNLGVARQISDRIYVMYGGSTVETSPTEELFADPKHPYTQGLISSIPQLSGDPIGDGIAGTVPNYLDPPEGCRFHPRCPYAHDRCTESKPEMFGTGQSGTACYLYDDAEPAPYGQPQTAETARMMSELDEPDEQSEVNYSD
jgi:peptide/nickel transport system ATP-binding protein